MGWTVGHTRISERNRWTSCGMFHGMGWTVGHTRISERDRWTSRGMSHNPMGSWDGMDRRIHAHLCEGQVDIPWNVPRSHGIVGWDEQWDARASVKGTGGHLMEYRMVPWDHGIGWTVGHTCRDYSMVLWDHGIGWTVGHTCRDYPMVLWDHGMGVGYTHN